MGQSYIQVLETLSPWIVLAVILGLFYLFKEANEALKYALNAFGLEKKKDIDRQKAIAFSEDIIKEFNEVNKKIDKLVNDFDTRMDKMQTDIDNVTEASREELGDKINTKFKHYFTLGYIPADEYGEFVNLHRAYKSVGGNHSGDAKFKRCEKLKIIDDTREEMKLEIQNDTLVENKKGQTK